MLISIENFLNKMLKSEKTSFKKMLRPGFFGNSDLLFKIYSDIEKILKKRNLTEKDLNSVIIKYDKSKSGIRNCKTKLRDKLTLFCAIKNTLKNDEYQIECLRQHFINKEDYTMYRKISAQNFKQVHTTMQETPETLLKKSHLAEEFYFHKETNKHQEFDSLLNTKHTSLIKSNPLQLADDNLDKFYLLKKLRFILEYKARAFLGFSEPTKPENKFVVQICREKYATQAGDFQILLLLIGCFSNPEDYSSINKVLEEIKDNHSFCTQELLQIAIDKLLILVNHLKSNRYVELKKLLIVADDLGLLLRDGKISDILFMSYANTFTTLREFDEVTKFIRKYEDFLPSAKKESTVKIAELFRDFHSGNSQAVLNAHNTFKSKDPKQEEIFQTLLIRSIYNDPNVTLRLLEKACENFRQHLYNRVHYSEKRKESYDEFRKLLYQLGQAKMQIGFPLKKMQKLLDDIQSKENVFARPWLLSQFKNIYLSNSHFRQNWKPDF